MILSLKRFKNVYLVKKLRNSKINSYVVGGGGGFLKVIRSPQASTLYGLGPEGIRNIEKTFLQVNEITIYFQ